MAELFLAMLWLGALLNAVFLLASLLLQLLVGRLSGGPVARPLAFSAATFIALHLTWGLWHRLAMAQQWVFPPRFLTWSGLFEMALLAAIGLIIVATGARLPRTGGMAVAQGGLAAGILVLVALSWNAYDERQQRRYSLALVRRMLPPAPSAAPSQGRALLVGVDGLSWGVMGPLLRAGRLPALATLIREGAIGVLDNADESYSPRIWNTLFSGRPVNEHGVYDFIKIHLPRSGGTVRNLLPQPPAIDSFYGLKPMLELVPNPGLWRVVRTDAGDVRVKRLWEVASEAGLRVAVMNALTTLPVRAVNGALVFLGQGAPAERFHPPSLYSDWKAWLGRHRAPGQAGSIEKPLVVVEAEFMAQIVRRFDARLGVYYTRAIDESSHRHWDFHAKGRFFLTDLPESLEDEAWERMVVAHADQEPFRSYLLVDAAIGGLRRDLPDATLVVCSDHGWTYGGYEHYGSPDGVLILAGPGVKPGADPAGSRTQDVFPTLAQLLGLPLSRQLSGRVLSSVLAGAAEPRYVDSYGEPSLPRRAPQALEAEERERLKALGYIH